MNVKVEVELCSSLTEKDREEIYEAAQELTDNENSVIISFPKKNLDKIIVEFTIEKARQIDIVDEIGEIFGDFLSNYNQSSISFPKKISAPMKRSKTL